MDSTFKQYRRKAIAELRPITEAECDDDYSIVSDGKISVSAVDIDKGSPRLGDMIARNPQNHEDQWLVTAKYFVDNFEPIEVSDA